MILYLLLFTHATVCAQQRDVTTVLKIHVVGNQVTKKAVIFNEITLEEGQSLPQEELAEEITASRNNLLNTSLFNFVTITPVNVSEHHIDLVIEVQERWYLWPTPLISAADPNANLWWETRSLSRLNYGAIVNHQNLRGMRENLGALIQFGYSKQFELFYNAPYLSLKRKIGGGVSGGYLQNYEMVYATANNERLFFFEEDGNSRQIAYAGGYLEKRITSRHIHRVETSFSHIYISDSAFRFTDNYLGNNLNSVQFFSINYTFRLDYRDNIHYPLQGSFLKLILQQHGIGIFKNENLNVQHVLAEGKYFHPFSDKFYWAGMLKGKVTTFNNLPYFFQQGLGYDDFVRGYEYYILDGQAFALAKTNFKYRIVAARQKNLPLIENGKFKRYFYAVYINTFADAGLVHNRISQEVNSLSNRLLLGGGIGLDFVTYYDKVVRFEFALNRLKEPGFYIHFTQPI